MSWKDRAIPADESSTGGWRDRAISADEPKAEDSSLDQALIALRSALEGHTAGISEPLVARAKAIATAGQDALRAPPGVVSEGEVSFAEQSPDFQEAIRRDVEQRRADKAAHPALDLGSQVVGGLIPTPLNMGSRVFKAGEAAAKGIKALQATEGAGKVAQTLAKGSQLAAGGALGSMGFEAIRQTAERPDGFIDGGSPGKDIATAGAIGGALGPAVPAVIEGAKGAGTLGKWLGKKAFSNIFGVSEENVGKYLANSERINQAKDIPELKGHLDEFIAQLKDRFDQGKLSQDQAEQALRDKKRELVQLFADQKMDAREAARKAEALLTESYSNAIEPLKSRKPPTEKAGDVLAMLDDLQSRVSKGSGEAMDLLRNNAEVIPTAPIKGNITKAIKGYQIEGAGPLTDTGEAAVRSLERFQDRLDKLPKKLALEEFKQIVQQLDRDISWKDAAGQYMDPASADKLAIRKQIDGILKAASPEYREAMIPVAEQAGLLSEASKAFGKERQAISRLSGINSPQGKIDLELLAQLENQTGNTGKVTNPAREYMEAKRILSNPSELEAIKRELPEYEAYRQAVADLARRNPKWTRSQIDAAMRGSKEARALALASEELSQSRQAYEPFKALSPASTESRLRSAMRGEDRGLENRSLLKKAGEETGIDFLQNLEDLAVRNSFEKGATNGSRNVVFGSVIGALMAGIPGAGGGAVYGRLLDQYGPKMAKVILDGTIALQKSPKVETIRNLNLPPEVKAEMEKGLKLYLIRSQESGGTRGVAEGDRKGDRKPADRNLRLKALGDE